MSHPYVWDWNAPRSAIDPATFGHEIHEESKIARLVALFDREEELTRQAKSPDGPKTYPEKIKAGADIRETRRNGTLTELAKKRLAAASDKDNPVLTRLYALPAYLRDPLKQH
ncbi:hypothetical protein AAT67_26280, partial [Salmonella enterica]|nr:hypothetical protein [Salmonella enterica]